MVLVVIQADLGPKGLQGQPEDCKRGGFLRISDAVSRVPPPRYDGLVDQIA